MQELNKIRIKMEKIVVDFITLVFNLTKLNKDSLISLILALQIIERKIFEKIIIL